MLVKRSSSAQRREKTLKTARRERHVRRGRQLAAEAVVTRVLDHE